MAQARKIPPVTPVRKKAEDRDLQAMREIADDVIESDFVPYACLYDAETLLTKNGELMHIIRITSQTAGATLTMDARAALREAIATHIPDSSYAIWLHTQRRRHEKTGAAAYPDPFSSAIEDAWRNQQSNISAYHNDLTITLVKAGQAATIKDLPSVIRSLAPKKETQRRLQYLDTSHRALRQVSKKILQSLAPYGARLLTSVQRADGVYYGEHLEFLESLINLQDRAVPLPRRDLSHELTSGDVTFGFNAMEVRTPDNKRRFATLMTVKEYKESTLKGIDQFLEIPCELIVTQCFDFIGASRAREAYEKQAEYLRISGDKEMAKWMEIDRLVEGDASNALAFGQQQTSIFLIAPSMKQLEANVRMVQKAFAHIGILAIREDLRLEECYWAQLPGNFPFLSRQHFIDSDHLAGFANLPAKALGNHQGSAWGPPITMLKTIDDTSYHFNFHRGANAHSLIIGRDAAAAAATAHFLVAQSRKLPIATWILDSTGRSETFVRSMGGNVMRPGTPQLRMNPLQLPDTPANREFLAVWLSTLVDPLAQHLNRPTLDFFTTLVMQAMQMPMAQRRLSNLLPIMRSHDAILAQQMQRWCEAQPLGDWFDMPQDYVNFGALDCIDLSQCQEDALRVPVVSYLLHRMLGALSGKPTLLVLNDALPLLNTPIFSSRVGGMLDFLTANNAACMAVTSTIAYASAYPYARTLSEKAATLIVHPDDSLDGEYMMGYGLQQDELSALAHMAKSGHQLLLKSGNEVQVVRLDTGVFAGAEYVLRGNPPLPPKKSPKEVLADLMGAAPVGA